LSRLVVLLTVAGGPPLALGADPAAQFVLVTISP
jgi:hypothetical protein